MKIMVTISRESMNKLHTHTHTQCFSKKYMGELRPNNIR